MSTENKLANKKRRSQKIAFGFFTATSYAIGLLFVIAFIVTRGIGLLAGNSLALCQKME
jgi:phosphate transport system permease protein